VPGFETHNCTGFGATTQVEVQEKRLYGVERNYSDRWVAIIAGTKHKKGNNPHTVYEAIRKYGLIPEDMLPFSKAIDTPEEYFSFKGADEDECYAEGRKWLETYEFKHEWLWGATRPANYLDVIREAQQTCSLGLGVSAWEKVNGEYVSTGKTNNHWTLGVNFVDGREQVFDTYMSGDTNLKILAKDHNIRYAKRIYLNRKTPYAQRKHISILETVLKSLRIMNLTLCEDVRARDYLHLWVALAHERCHHFCARHVVVYDIQWRHIHAYRSLRHVVQCEVHNAERF